MEEALRAILAGSASVTALTGTRIDWGMRPQGQSMPAIALTNVNDGAIDHSQDGPGLSQARVQIDCYGGTYAAAKTTARAVRTLLDGYRGGMFQGAFLAGARDLSEGEGETRVHRVSMDFIITYNFTS